MSISGDAFKGVSLKNKAKLLVIAAKHRLPIGDPEAVLAKLHEFTPDEAMLVLTVFDEDLPAEIRRKVVEHPFFETFLGRILALCSERERIDPTAALAQMVLGIETCGITLPFSVRQHLPNTVEADGHRLYIVTPRSGHRAEVNLAGLSSAAADRLVRMAGGVPVEQPVFDWQAMAGL